MKLIFIDTMRDNLQRGGAYLRNKAIKEIYQSLGLEVDTHYSSEFNPRSSLSSFYKRLIFGKETSILFKECSARLGASDFIHFDNLRHFNWNFESINGRVIYNAHNLEFENYFARDNRSIKKSRFINYELDKMESSYLTFVCSDREKQTLLSLRPSLEQKIFVLPNLVDSSEYSVSKDKKVISFIGTLSYFPNVEAIKYLCERFMPALPQNIKDEYEFVVAGRLALLGQKEACEKAGFSFRTDLSEEEIKQLFSDTAISLVPIEHGSGTRLKIIESIFSESIVLSTALGREGIESEGIVESELESFPQSLVEIIESKKVITLEIKEEFKKSFDTKTWIEHNLDRLKPFFK